MRKKGFRTRSFVSLLVAISFLLLTATGLVLYVVPTGRMANWMGWRLLFMDKETWARVHTVLGFAFLVGGPFHLAFNWKPFRTYLAARWAEHLRPRRELLAASLLAVVLTVVAVGNLPPVSYVTALGSWAKSSWSPGTALRPPPGKPDELTLADLAARIGTEPALARSALEGAGIRLDDPNQSLESIAATNRISPQTLFELVSRAVPATRSPVGDDDHAAGSGSGIGRMSIAEVATANGVPLETALARLGEAGYAAGGDDRVRDIAGKVGATPTDLVEIIRGDPR